MTSDGPGWPRLVRPSRSTAERGSALVIAMLISVILALLGISFLMIAETESKLAQNEKRAAQTLYVAEAGLRVVKTWFDTPGGSLHFPGPSVVDRTLRRIIDESDPYDPNDVVTADGILGSYPYYKQGVDLDGDGVTDLFERPYRDTKVHYLLGTEDGPDMRIDDADPSAAAFLAGLSDALFADFPGEPGGITARISRIDIFAPPYTPIGSTWRRYGMGSIKVTARIYRDVGGTLEMLGENAVKAVLSELPYLAPHAPLHSCGDTVFVPRTGGDVTVRWGAISSVGATRVTNDINQFNGVSKSLSRDLPFRPGADQLWPPDLTAFDTYADEIDGDGIEDPWFRILSGGEIYGAGSGSQPYPHSAVDLDRSNLIQNQSLVVCPKYDYELWKGIAASGTSDVHYFVHVGSGNFSEDGTAPGTDFETITNGQEGVYFFDTLDRVAPNDIDGDDVYDNLTPPISLSGSWNFKGFIYLNSRSIMFDGTTGLATTVEPPGEPFLDVDMDGAYDAGERFINLDYPITAAGVHTAVDADTLAGGATRDGRGPAIPGVPVSFRGIFYNTGYFEATGTGSLYGTVVALQGVTQNPSDGTADTPTIIWDESIAADWPPPGWDLPRVVITEWDTDG